MVMIVWLLDLQLLCNQWLHLYQH